jgi:SAM-dependent methyltransferase
MAAKRSFAEIPPDELAACCREHASQWKVSPAVHPQDFIFRFILHHGRFSGMDDAVRYYFEDARQSAELLKSILENDLSVQVAERKRMLEFASGYGAVTRHLPAVFPAFEITSSDIHPAANRFIVEVLHGKAIQSSAVPECFKAGGEYDFVFALSLFSHLPAATWSRWLSVLFKTVCLGGSLIFTTHGPTSLRKMRMDISLDEEGFYFEPESEQDDLDKDEYGMTFASIGFVIRQVEALENCELRVVRAGFWWNHQDLYVLSKVPSIASLPVADLNTYTSDEKVEGYVDRISFRKKKRALSIMGWATPDVRGDQAADSIIVLFQSEDGSQFSYEAVREDRPDVAKGFKNPALVRTGFRATIDLSGLKGNLTLRLAVRCDTQCKLCDNVSIPLHSVSLSR